MLNRIAMQRVVYAAALIMSGFAAQSQLNATNRPNRRIASTEYHIMTPTYINAGREEWRARTNDVCSQLREIARRTLADASDNRLTIEQKSSALMIAECLNVELTAEGLITIIDLKDDRVAHFSDIARGPYPVVTILKHYGAATERFIVPALRDEASVKRRELLCEVLHSVVGVDQAVMELRKGIENEQMTSEEKDRLQLAIDEVERQANPRP